MEVIRLLVFPIWKIQAAEAIESSTEKILVGDSIMMAILVIALIIVLTIFLVMGFFVLYWILWLAQKILKGDRK